MTIRIAHDFTCPWCWIALHQTHHLKAEFPELNFDWVGYELWPESIAWPEPGEKPEENPNRAKTPSRLDLAYDASGISKPTIERPKRMRIHAALEAVEFARESGADRELIEAFYRALYEEGKAIGEPQVIAEIAQGIVPNVPEMLEAIQERRYADRIVPFDEDAHSAGVYNVPTFFIDGARYAEQPTRVLREAIRQALSVASV